ncbi:mitochondrial ribosomal death-associated protein 3-domain-containing protein [Myxozyma melibiosi]|uniref:Small ribosomal subunit protein mS29 n=1 Tax=Myxozyma melibiosi TaxID=54550 RepID=A0ABR1F6H3_9ASCO
MSARLFQHAGRSVRQASSASLSSAAAKSRLPASSSRQFGSSAVMSAKEHVSKKERAEQRAQLIANKMGQVREPKIKRFAPKKSATSSIYSFEKTVETAGGDSASGERKVFKPTPPVREDQLLKETVVFSPAAEAGHLALYSEKTMKMLKSNTAILPKQYFNLFSEGATIVREATKELQNTLADVTESLTSAKSVVLTGPSGSGKSVVLQQAVAIAHQLGCLVIHISDVEDLIDGSHDYKFDPETGLYDQPMYAKRLLRKICAAYDLRTKKENPLFQHTLLNSYTFHGERGSLTTLQAGEATIQDLILAGAENSENAIIGLKGLFAELESQKIPTFLSIDNLSVLAESYYTQYRSAEFEKLRHPSFWLTKTIVDYVSGAREFASGFTVAALEGDASSMTIKDYLNIQKPWNYIQLLESRYDPELVDALRGARQLEVAQFNLNETELMLDYYRHAGVILRFEEDLKNFLTSRSAIENRIYALSPEHPRMGFQMLPKLEQEELAFGNIASVTEVADTVADGIPLYSGPLLRRVRVYHTLAYELGDYNIRFRPIAEASAASATMDFTLGTSVTNDDIDKFINNETISSSSQIDELTLLIDERRKLSSRRPAQAQNRYESSENQMEEYYDESAGYEEAKENDEQLLAVVKIAREQQQEFWRRFVTTRHVSTGHGNPRALMKSVLFPFL